MPESQPPERPDDTPRPTPLRLTVGCAFELEVPFETTAVMQVATFPDARVQVEREGWDTGAVHHSYIDGFGNRCERLTLPPGQARLAYEAHVTVADPDDHVDPDMRETPVADLPDDVLVYTMPSRFCLPDELGHEAWQRFGGLAPGWSRVQAIADAVHGHLVFDHTASNPWTTAKDVFVARQGVCRDYAHLMITFCRALNIPARYVFGYIPAIGPGAIHEEMDFAAWVEVWMDGGWHTIDARNNTPRTGRVVVGRGRDAVDVALITSYGPLTFRSLTVTADEVVTLP